MTFAGVRFTAALSVAIRGAVHRVVDVPTLLLGAWLIVSARTSRLRHEMHDALGMVVGLGFLAELLRAVAAFMTAPMLLPLALTVNGGATGTSITTNLWICFAIAATGLLLPLYAFVLGRAHLQCPAFERWQRGEGPAWHSPPLASGIRGKSLERFLAER